MRLIYFSPVRWDTYEQRPHYFARHFLEAGGDAVTWINPYPARLPEWRDLARLSQSASGLILERPARLQVVDINGWPIDPLPGGAWLNRRLRWRDAIGRLARSATRSHTVIGIGRPTALALTALETLDHAWSFYDAMDDFPEFYRGLSRRATRQVETAIVNRVSRVYASSTHLVQKFSSAERRVTLLRNAYDMALLPPPSGADRSNMSLGFLGCLGGWLDWPLVCRIAQAVSPRRVVMVGPRPVPIPVRLPTNVECHPECHQSETARWLGTFAAGLIPFKRDRLTSGIDPIKYYQYRGAGLPVVSTAFGEMCTRDNDEGTFFLDDTREPAGVIHTALAFRPSAAAVSRFRETNTWTARFSAAHLFALP